MKGDGDLRSALQRIQAPNELDAQRRAWSLARSAFEAREPLSWERRHRGALLAAAAAVVLLAAAISPPGRALVGSVRDAVTDEQVATPAGADLAARFGPAPRQLQDRAVDRPGGRIEASAGTLVARRLVSQRGIRGRDAAARGGRPGSGRKHAVVDRPLRHRSGRALVLRGESARHADRVPERTGAQSRRGERPGGQGASSARRHLCSRLAAGSVRAGLLDRRRPDRARRRRDCEDGLANRPR